MTRSQALFLAAVVGAVATTLEGCGSSAGQSPAVPPPGPPLSLLAGGTEGLGSADGTGAAARFNYPYGVATDVAGNVYVADSGNHLIRKVTAAGVVTTLAGAAGQVGSADGTGATARFNAPTGVATDAAGNV